MKKVLVAFGFALSVVAGIEAAPTDTVTQADLKVLLDRLSKLEAENKAQAARIAELENQDKQMRKWVDSQNLKVAEQDKKWELQNDRLSQVARASFEAGEGTTTNESGRIYTTAQGFKYYLADVNARIFEPLSESGLKITPYGYLVFEGVYNTRGAVCDTYTDWLYNPHSRGYGEHMSSLSMQDSILGLQFETPEAHAGWKFIGRAEFDMAGDHGNDYAFHWRHLYFDAQHEADDWNIFGSKSGSWSILFGQTWHLWKMVSPTEIDGAWMEQAGHPYRRSPQIRVTRNWEWDDSSLNVRVGIVKNGPGMGGDRDEDGVQDNSASAWPLFEAAAVYDHDAPWQDENDNTRRWLIGLGGMYGQNRIRNRAEFNDDKEDYNSMMIMLGGIIPFWDFTLTGQIFTGENLGGIQAGVGQTVAFNQQGYGEEVQTVGGFIDLSYQFTSDFSMGIGYGFDNPIIHGDYIEGSDGLSDSRTLNDRAYIDAFYQITTNFKIGIEYARLSTHYAGNDAYLGGVGRSDRFQFSAYYDF